MARSWPSLGLFGVFGRSGELRALDDALRAAGMHPALAPEAVKIAALNLLKEATGEQPAAADYGDAAALLGYCALGPVLFAEANGEPSAVAAGRRIEAALEVGGGLDASLILLALHAAIIHPGVRAAYELESE
jgi:hypothetical protein